MSGRGARRYYDPFDGRVMFRGISRIGLWRLAAAALVLCAGYDILAVDTGLWNPRGSAACCDDSPSNEDCFCCCRHIVVPPPVGLKPVQVVTAFVAGPVALPESAPAPVPELPPRA